MTNYEAPAGWEPAPPVNGCARGAFFALLFTAILFTAIALVVVWAT